MGEKKPSLKNHSSKNMIDLLNNYHKDSSFSMFLNFFKPFFLFDQTCHRIFEKVTKKNKNNPKQLFPSSKKRKYFKNENIPTSLVFLLIYLLFIKTNKTYKTSKIFQVPPTLKQINKMERY